VSVFEGGNRQRGAEREEQREDDKTDPAPKLT
jgi:hypothetical protein